MPTVFRLGGDSDALDVWKAESLPEFVSFSSGGESAATVWRIELPADRRAADAILTRAETDLRASAAALDEAQARMAAFAARPVGDVSFGLGESERAADANLRALLDDEPTMQSFSLGDVVGDAWKEAVAKFEQFTAWVRDAVAGYSRVETVIGGVLIAATRVNLSGDLLTTLGTSEAVQIAQHERAINLMLASRAALVRTVAVALGGAVGLAGLISRPDGLLRAIPAALRYIEDVRAEYRKFLEQEEARANQV